MKLNIETWTKTYLPKAVSDCKCKPASGIATAVATCRYIRDEMLKEVKDEDKPIVLDFFNGEDGLIQQLAKAKTLNGFASNASAAAKAAGLSTESENVSDLVD